MRFAFSSRPRGMFLSLVTTLVITLCTTLCNTQAIASEQPWLALDQALTQARKEQRPVLVHFYADWCSDCHKMAAAFERNGPLKERLKAGFIPVRLSQKGLRMISYQGKIWREDQLVRHLQPPGFPTLMFYTAQGQEIGKIPGYLAPDELMRLLDFIQTGAYQKITFTDFLKVKGAQ